MPLHRGWRITARRDPETDQVIRTQSPIKSRFSVWDQRCLDCRMVFPREYMVQDSLWEQAVPHGERDKILCLTCCEKRLSRRLNEDEDLQPGVPVNLSPYLYLRSRNTRRRPYRKASMPALFLFFKKRFSRKGHDPGTEDYMWKRLGEEMRK